MPGLCLSLPVTQEIYMNDPKPKSLSVHFSTHEQTAENLHNALDTILKRLGCLPCGLIARFRLDLGDPIDAKVAKQGIMSMISGMHE